MMKISDLQSQIKLNSNVIFNFEMVIIGCMNDIIYLQELINERGRGGYLSTQVENNRHSIVKLKKQIKQYAKLQRALKSELAYRIQCNRMTREVEALTEKAKTEGWEVVIEEDL